MPTPAQLANRHLKLTLWGGLVLIIPLSIVAALGIYGAGRPVELAPEFRVWRSALAMMGVLALWAVVPALATSLLHLWPMRWLFRWLRQYPTRFSWMVGIEGTFLLVANTILLETLLLYQAVGRLEFTSCFQACTAISMPWLLSSLWAT